MKIYGIKWIIVKELVLNQYFEMLIDIITSYFLSDTVHLYTIAI